MDSATITEDRVEVVITKHGNSRPTVIAEIIVGDRYRKNLGDLEPLKASIADIGLLHPVVIDNERRLLVGGRRLEACKQLGLLTIPAVTAASLADLRQRVIAEKDENVCREPFRPSEMVALGKVIEDFQRPIAEKAKLEGGKEGGKEGGRPPKTLRGTSPKGSKPQDESKRTSSVAAAACGVDRRTYEKAKAVTKAAEQSPKKFGPLVEQMDRTGKVNKAYSELRKQTKRDDREAARRKIEKATGVNVSMRCQAGEVWTLGDHVLYCGDTSSAEFLALLSDRAALAFADPPYGANVAGYDDSKFYWKHDYLIDKAEIVVVTPGIVSIFELARITSMPYRWSVAAWITNGMTRGAVGFGNWIYAAVFSTGSVFRQSQDHFKVAISNAESEATDHPTRKPTEYMQWIVETFSKPKQVVIDPFLGSGQTLMVCEQSGRRCIGGELDPKFCSEIVCRWESLTKKTAVKA